MADAPRACTWPDCLTPGQQAQLCDDIGAEMHGETAPARPDQRETCGCGEAAEVATLNADRLRERIARAVDDTFEQWTHGLGDQRPQDAITQAVHAAIQPELDALAEAGALREEQERYEEETVGRFNAQTIRLTRRTEKAEAVLARVRALADRWDRDAPPPFNQPLTELRAALDNPGPETPGDHRG